MSTAPTVPAAITPLTTIGELVAARPALSRFFEKLGIDYCCGGKQTLAAACARRGLEVAATLALLNSAAAAFVACPEEADTASMSLTQMANHLETTHHAYFKADLPRLVEMADRVATKHQWRDARLADLAEAVHGVADQMISHIQKTESDLFPLLREMEASGKVGLRGRELAARITELEGQHQVAGELTARLRELTDGFTPNTEACNTHRALLAGLADFESDLHRHAQQENSVLFPRALALATSAGTT